MLMSLGKLILLSTFIQLCLVLKSVNFKMNGIQQICRKKKSTGMNSFIINPEELDRDWKLPFRNASQIWKEFVPWIDKPVNFTQLPKLVQRVIIEHRKEYGFHINYTRKHPCWILESVDLYCEMKKHLLFRTIKFGDYPFITDDWKKTLPKKEYNEILPRYKSCAVVSSSSSLSNLSLGAEIDRHEAVIRFNFAPTESFEKDVGAKTTIRMINSMAFYTNYNLFVNMTRDSDIIFHFDPSTYYANLTTWYDHPQFLFHELYKKHRRAHPNQTFFLIDPRSLWSMWDFIQDYSGDMVQKTITSSGFMGNIIAMNLCDVTHVYGYLPSPTSITKKCYYFKDLVDMTCTYGGYHPELYEKNIMVQLKQGERDDVAQWGRITLPGFNDLSCLSPDI